MGRRIRIAQERDGRFVARRLGRRGCGDGSGARHRVSARRAACRCRGWRRCSRCCRRWRSAGFAAAASAAAPAATFAALTGHGLSFGRFGLDIRRRRGDFLVLGCFKLARIEQSRFGILGHKIEIIRARLRRGSRGSWRFVGCGCFWRGAALRRSRYRSAQAFQRLLGLLFPFRAAEALRGDGVPLDSLIAVAGAFLNDGEFVGGHRVARARIKRGKLRGRIGASFGFADARLNLLPVTH